MRKKLYAASAIAGVLFNLVNRVEVGNTTDEQLIIDAIKRSSNATADMTNSELGEYVAGFNQDQLSGFMNNIKGITLENYVVDAENQSDNGIDARQFENTNHPGADVQFVKDGEVVSEFQVKATDSKSYIDQHFEKYPDTPVIGTSDIAMKDDRVLDAGISNAELENDVSGTLSELESLSTAGQAADAAIGSGLLAGGALAIAALNGKIDAKTAAEETATAVGVSVSTSFLVDLLLS
jgi:hypothetical protein